MKPVTQSRTGLDGNCFESCIASLLELQLAEVPDLAAYEDDGRWLKKLNEWLGPKYGLAYLELSIAHDETDNFFSDKDFYHVMIGPTERSGKIKHAVIGRKGRMVHDPHPSQRGILREDSFLMIGVLVKACIEVPSDGR